MSFWFHVRRSDGARDIVSASLPLQLIVLLIAVVVLIIARLLF